MSIFVIPEWVSKNVVFSWDFSQKVVPVFAKGLAIVRARAQRSAPRGQAALQHQPQNT